LIIPQTRNQENGTKGKNMSKFMKLSANLCKQSQINPDIPKAKHKLNQQTTKE
jgi:hypothetical protein